MTGNIAIEMASADDITMLSTAKAGEALSQINARGKLLMYGRVQTDGGIINLAMKDSTWK